ncbi:MAG TPA: acyl-CoA dehydrogenase [Acidimicrobiia bacterium]
MNLDLTDDQVALRDGIRALLDGRFDSARIRRGFDRAMWDELAGAGVFSLRADGFGWADTVVVFEQLGISCVPGPLVAGSVAHGLVDGIVAGAGRPRDGNAVMIEHLDRLDTLLVIDEAGVWKIDPSTVDGDEVTWPLDPLTPVWRVGALPQGEQLAGPDLPAAWQWQGEVLSAAFALGLAQRMTELSVAYAKEREQFDRPIGSFQAIKHLLADMLVRTEVARAAVYAAGAHLDDPDLEGAARVISGATLLATEAAITNGKAATQVHGGMGFTWEVDVHLYLKRAWVLDTLGSVDHCADAVAATLTAESARNTAHANERRPHVGPRSRRPPRR